MRIRQSDVLYPELSYKVMGVIFKVHNKLGPGYQERYYQRAIAQEFTEQRIPFEREVVVPLHYEGKSVGRYFIDFVIDDKIALEIKRAGRYGFRSRDIQQLFGYLRSLHLKLGILSDLGGTKVRSERVVNFLEK